MRVACVQLRSGGDVNRNVADAEELIRAAAGAGAEMVATPEMTTLLVRDREELVSKLDGSAAGVARLGELAAELGIHLLLGSAAVRQEGTIRNRAFLFGPDGVQLTHYDKMHMFDVDVSEREMWRESRTYLAGDVLAAVDVSGMRLGMTICYDLRFAEMFRAYAREGCEIIAVPAAFTVPTGRAHWEVLLRARAIETGAFILAPAQGGRHDDSRETYGHSCIIGPWGEILAQLESDEPGYILSDIDRAEVERARARIPVWSMEPRI